jgi:hypothetical protein
VAVDPSKVKDVLEWEQPKNVKDIRSFLGLSGYYRRFIENFSKISKPMTELLKKVFLLSGRMLVKKLSKFSKPSLHPLLS